MTNPRTVDITPDVSLLKKAGEVNYKIPDAVAELVDNPLDERAPGHKLTVEVNVGQSRGQKFLQVQDDARGMTPDQAAAAMVMARSTKTKGKIGEFGMGMKTACSNLGAHFEIMTCTADATHATRLIYDEDDFIAAGKWEVEMEEVDKPFPHGTRITITKPKTNFYAGVKSTMLQKFGKLFKHYVASGEVEIIVNSEAVEPYVPETIPEYDTEFKFDVNGKVVRGWAGLSKTSSMKGAYGFDLVRQNRVIKEHVKIGFAPAAGLARLIGELHLDDFPVTNNKTDFRVDTEEWKQLEDKLAEILTDLKRESRNRANPGRNQSPKDQAEVKEYIDEVKDSLKQTDLQQDLDRRALDSDLAVEFAEGPLPFHPPFSDGVAQDSSYQAEYAGETPTADADSDSPGEVSQIGTVTQARLNRVKTQLRNITIEHQVMRLGKDTPYKIWDIEGVGNRKKLVVTSNIDHPFYNVIDDGFMLWIKHNIVEAVAEFFTESTGKTDAMLLIKSDILKHIGRMKLEIAEAQDLGDASEGMA
jgi:Histidine kinase-, DNA gyrase B-, and HSP90-like ATPase